MPASSPTADTIETLSMRLRVAAKTARDADDYADDERQRRDRLIVEAVREGMPYRTITELTGLSRTRVLAVVARAPQVEAPAAESSRVLFNT